MTYTLYQRLGEAAGISRLVDDVMAAHLANPLVNPRFRAIKDIDHAKRMALEFFCAGAGGPQAYTGKDMRTAHTGMNISEQEFLAVTDDIVNAMEKHKYDEETKGDVVAILYSLKRDIIRI
jgi:hemoglobin